MAVISMDAGWIRATGTVVLFGSFVWLCIWAWLPAQRRRFDEAAMMPFRDDAVHGSRTDEP